MGILSRLMPKPVKKVRRAAHPVRSAKFSAKRAVVPRGVHRALNPGEALESDLARAMKGPRRRVVRRSAQPARLSTEPAKAPLESVEGKTFDQIYAHLTRYHGRVMVNGQYVTKATLHRLATDKSVERNHADMHRRGEMRRPHEHKQGAASTTSPVPLWRPRRLLVG